MKKTSYLPYLISTAGIMVIAFSLASYSGGPPPSRTGAPGESTCQAGCHNTFPLNSGAGNINLTLNGSLPAYKPDTVYTVQVTVNEAAKTRYGFQLTALDSTRTGAVGEFISGTSSGIQTGSVAGHTREYINHSPSNTSGVWTFSWKAPSQRIGPITFYLVGNAAQGDNTSSGDNIYTKSFIMAQSTPPPPVPPVAGFTQSKDSAFVGDSVTFTSTATGDITAYFWDFGSKSSLPTSNARGPHKVAFTDTGTFTVKHKVSGPGGADSATKKLVVRDKVGGLGSNQVMLPWKIYGGSEERIWINASASGSVQLQIYSLSGQRIWSERLVLRKGLNPLNAPLLKPGLVLCRVMDHQTEIWQRVYLP